MRAEIELSQPQFYGTSYLLVRIALTGHVRAAFPLLLFYRGVLEMVCSHIEEKILLFYRCASASKHIDYG